MGAILEIDVVVAVEQRSCCGSARTGDGASVSAVLVVTHSFLARTDVGGDKHAGTNQMRKRRIFWLGIVGSICFELIWRKLLLA